MPPPNSWKKGSTWTRCTLRAEMLTTAGCSFATMSAKLMGAPGFGAAAWIVPGSFCAVCAVAGPMPRTTPEAR